MKICLVTEHFPPHIGGVEQVFEAYARFLAQAGHEVRVITSDSGGLQGRHELMAGATVWYLACPSFFGHPMMPMTFLQPHIAWADIVHTTTYTAAYPAQKLAHRLGKPCILMVHEALRARWFTIEQNPLKALLFLLFERFVITRPFTRWQAISQATKQDIERLGIAPEKIILIPHGLDMTHWHPDVKKRDLHALLQIPEQQKILLYNGRLGKTKGVDLLLQAARLIRSTLPSDYVFGFILGTNNKQDLAAFQKEISRLELSSIVRVLPALPYLELPGYRKDAAVFIVPSRTEGFGFTAAETSALGVPILSSTAGSLPEVVSGQVLFFRNGDANDLAKKILLATKGQFETLPPKRFLWEQTSQAVIALYRSLL